MKGRAFIVPVDERNTVFRGAGLGGWFKAQRIPALRSPARRGWYVRTERVADVVARLEQDGYVVRRAAE